MILLDVCTLKCVGVSEKSSGSPRSLHVGLPLDCSIWRLVGQGDLPHSDGLPSWVVQDEKAKWSSLKWSCGERMLSLRTYLQHLGEPPEHASSALTEMLGHRRHIQRQAVPLTGSSWSPFGPWQECGQGTCGCGPLSSAPGSRQSGGSWMVPERKTWPKAELTIMPPWIASGYDPDVFPIHCTQQWQKFHYSLNPSVMELHSYVVGTAMKSPTRQSQRQRPHLEQCQTHWRCQHGSFLR